MALRCPDIRANSSKVTNTADTGGKKKKNAGQKQASPSLFCPREMVAAIITVLSIL